MMLRVLELFAAYGPVEALSGVSLEVGKGEIVSLIGANGAGKSTLLFSLFGHPPPQSGRVFLDGEEITGLSAQEIARRGMALAPEGRRIFAGMTVEENLLMGAMGGGTGEMDGILQRFPILRERRRQRAGTLSGGEQQMLALGRALMSRPRLLLLDEPSLGLAPLMVKRIFAILKELNQEGTTLFLVEQNANQALKLAHRGYVLVNGRIQLSGTGAALLEDPEVRRAYLGGG